MGSLASRSAATTRAQCGASHELAEFVFVVVIWDAACFAGILGLADCSFLRIHRGRMEVKSRDDVSECVRAETEGQLVSACHALRHDSFEILSLRAFPRSGHDD